MHLSTVEALLEYEVQGPTHFCFHIEAAHWPAQIVVSEALSLPPALAVHRYEDLRFGNRFVRFNAPPGWLALRYQAEVRLHPDAGRADLTEEPVGRLPDEIFPYLLPSRYCESDRLLPIAQKMFGEPAPGVSRVLKVVDWIRDNIAYRPGSTCSATSAHQVFEQRAGVCRDFAHLSIALCRALSIPARMVAGYVWFDEPPQDFHAVFEAWLGGRWVLFDPTGMAPVDRLVRVGTGRDAKDVAFCTYFGEIRLRHKEVTVFEHDARTVRAPPVHEAVPV